MDAYVDRDKYDEYKGRTCIRRRDMDAYVDRDKYDEYKGRTCIRRRDMDAYVDRYTYDGYDITRQLRSIILRINIVLRTFSKCSIDVKLHLFQS